MRLVIVALLIFSCRVSLARLGETETACAMRYNHGQDVEASFKDKISPLVPGTNNITRTYKYEGWTIRIGFVQGIACRVEYGKAISAGQIGPEEVNALLEANGGLKAWRQVTITDFPNPTEQITKLIRHARGSVWWRRDGSFAYCSDAFLFRLENRQALHLDLLAQREKQKEKAAPIPRF